MTKEEKISYMEGLCDSMMCRECPAFAVSEKVEVCDFSLMEENTLDEYLKAFRMIPSGECVCGEDPVAQKIPDAVHPNHYKLPNGMQVVDVEVAMLGKVAVKEHCLCTAVEYILRHKGKNGAEDIRKAHWWLSKWVELEDANEEASAT